jgi:hypothetical protein
VVSGVEGRGRRNGFLKGGNGPTFIVGKEQHDAWTGVLTTVYSFRSTEVVLVYRGSVHLGFNPANKQLG